MYGYTYYCSIIRQRVCEKYCPKCNSISIDFGQILSPQINHIYHSDSPL